MKKEFIQTKHHNIPYLIHSYCNIQNKEDFINNNSYKKDWNDLEFRKKYIEYNFENFLKSTEEESLMYIKGKTESKIKSDIDNLKNEIKSCKICANIKARAKETIINQINILMNILMKNRKNSILIIHYNN